MVVRLVGEIDLNSVGSMRKVMSAALAEATVPHPVVLDLTGVGFLASAGLAELQLADQDAAEQHIPLRVVATGHVVLRSLEVTGLAATLDIRSDLTAALASDAEAGGRSAL